jgi:hypothetical protein
MTTCRRKSEWTVQLKSREEDMKRKKDMKKRNRERHLTLKFQMEEVEKQDLLLNHWNALTNGTLTFPSTQFLEEHSVDVTQLQQILDKILTLVNESEALLDKYNIQNRLNVTCKQLFLQKNIIQFVYDAAVQNVQLRLSFVMNSGPNWS